MTGVRSWTLVCNGPCGQTLDDGSLGAETLEQARDHARGAGAHVGLPGGTDLCGECWDDGYRIMVIGRYVVRRGPDGSRNLTVDEGIHPAGARR